MHIGKNYKETYEKIVKARKEIELNCNGRNDDQANRKANIYAVRNTHKFHNRGFLHI